jgi:DNA polymerase (family 10)
MDFHVQRGLDDRPRHLLWSVENTAERLEAELGRLAGVTKVSGAGSLRRKQDTVGDLNFMVTGRAATPIFWQFERLGPVASWVARGRAARAFTLSSGITVELQWTTVSR